MINKLEKRVEANYYVGLEICWILTNVACGPEEVVKELFYNQLVDSAESEASPVIAFC